jgi:flagellar hook-length control protein FliK
MTSAPHPSVARSTADNAHAQRPEFGAVRRGAGDSEHDFSRQVDDAQRSREGSHRREDTQPAKDRPRTARHAGPKDAPDSQNQTTSADSAPETTPEATQVAVLPNVALPMVAVAPPTATATPAASASAAAMPELGGAPRLPAPATESAAPDALALAQVDGATPAEPANVAQLVHEFASAAGDRTDATPAAPPPASTHVHAAPEKPAAPAPTPQEASPTLAHERSGEILRQLRMHLVPEQRLATIQLEPASLGRIAIRLAMRKGHVDAQLRVEQRDTLAVLMRHVPELRAALERQGIHSGAFDMQLGFQDRGADQHAPGEARPAVREHSAAPPAALRAALARSLVPSNGVDTYA